MDLPLVVPGLLPLAIGAALWARWLVRARDEVPGFVRFVPAAVLLVVALSLATTIYGLRAAFSSIGSVNPAEKATVLAEGISTSMNATAAGYALVLLALLVLLVVTLRSKRRERA